MKSFLFCCFALIFTTLLSACIFDSTGDLAVAKLQVSIESQKGDSLNTGVPKGFSPSLIAIATLYDGSTEDVTNQVFWHSSDQAVVKFENNKALAVAQGTALVSAGFRGIESNQLRVEVTDAVLVELQLTPALTSLPVGISHDYQVLATFSDSSIVNVTDEVTWSLSDEKVASINSGQLLSLMPGSIGLSASLLNVQSNLVELAVTDAELVSIQVTPSDLTIAFGTNAEYLAIGTYTDNSTQEISNLVEWNSSDTDVATIADSIATTIAQGSTIISASFKDVSSNNVALTVTAAELVSIQVTPASSSLPEGSTQTYVATGTYTDDSTQDISHLVTWNSSATDIATIVNDLATAVDEGTSVISASFNGVSGSGTLIVIEEELVSIQVTPALSFMPEGSSQTYVATGTYTDGSTLDISGLVAWNSSATDIATIVNGLATAVDEGVSVISASTNGIASSATLTVIEEELVSIQVTPALSSLPEGSTQVYVATGTYTDDSTLDISGLVSWNSSDTSVAVIIDGLATATAQGTSLISASLGGVNSNKAIQTVTAEELVSVQVTPATSSIAKGNTQRFIATGTYTDSSTQDISNMVSWNSTDTGVATVVDGLVTGVVEGSSTITASLAGYTINSSSLTVTAAVLSSIEVNAPSQLLVNGRTSTYSATGVYSDSTTADLTSIADWSSSNASIATISGGNAIAVATGSAEFTASFNGVNSSGTNLSVVDTVPVCGATPASSDCILYSTGISGNAAGKLFTAGPSLSIVSAMGYTSMHKIANSGLTYAQAIAEDGTYAPEGIYVRFRNDGAGGGQYDRFCLDLNNIAFDGKTNWRRATRFELSDLFNDYGNMFVNQGWPASSGYWSSNYYGYSGTYDTDLYWFVAMRTGANYIQIDWTPRPASCVSD